MIEFLVAQNPDAASNLPFLLYLPVDGGLWLKAKEDWPRSSRVFCAPAAQPPSAISIIERVPVLSCRKTGPAIDLVLKRRMNKRSQFVFVTYRGRRQIFWQTPKAAQAARPGLRIPHARVSGGATFVIDSRERYGYSFAGEVSERGPLACGDYAVMNEQGHILAAVERKTLEDFATSLVDASLAFEMMELAALPHAVVVVEASYSQVLRYDRTRRNFLPELIGRLAVLYPHVPILFLETRATAEEWVRRFLRTADAHARAMPLNFTMSIAKPTSSPSGAVETKGTAVRDLARGHDTPS